MQNKLKKLENSIKKSKKSEKETQKLNKEVMKIKKNVTYLKEFKPESMMTAIQQLNENIIEMNSLFRLATELMQKSDPIESKLNNIFSDNEKIANGILNILGAVNELKKGREKEEQDFQRLENEIKLPLKDMASRGMQDDEPAIPVPPAEFMDNSNNNQAPEMPAPPTMSKMPSPEAAATPIQPPNVMPKVETNNNKQLTGGPIPQNAAVPSGIPSSQNFSADELDQLASQVSAPSQAPPPLQPEAKEEQKPANGRHELNI